LNAFGVTPAESDANDNSWRPFTGSSSICFCEIVWLTDAVCVCSSGDSPATVMVSATLARPSVTVGRATSPFRRVNSFSSTVWNPASSTRIV
jgi:hypothetical protein